MDASLAGTVGCHWNRHSCSTSHVMVVWSFKEQLVNPFNVSIDFRLENCVFSIGVCPCNTLKHALFCNYCDYVPALAFATQASLFHRLQISVCFFICHKDNDPINAHRCVPRLSVAWGLRRKAQAQGNGRVRDPDFKLFESSKSEIVINGT